MATGAIEVLASDLTIINRAEALPLDSNHVNTEEARLKYRYGSASPGDGTAPENPCENHQLVRRFMDDHGFLDIETPMLTKATPEGARLRCHPAFIKANSTRCRSLHSCLNSC